jgi:hypothetical protein
MEGLNSIVRGASGQAYIAYYSSIACLPCHIDWQLIFLGLLEAFDGSLLLIVN